MAISFCGIPHHEMIHESDKLDGCICNHCLHLEVLVRRKCLLYEEKYYCTPIQHGYFNPRGVLECDRKIYDTSELKPRKLRFNNVI